jgi:hypothetical protein
MACSRFPGPSRARSSNRSKSKRNTATGSAPNWTDASSKVVSVGHDPLPFVRGPAVGLIGRGGSAAPSSCGSYRSPLRGASAREMCFRHARDPCAMKYCCRFPLAPSRHRRRQYNPCSGDDHAIRRLPRLARRRAACRHSPGALLRKARAPAGQHIRADCTTENSTSPVCDRSVATPAITILPSAANLVSSTGRLKWGAKSGRPTCIRLAGGSSAFPGAEFF